MELLPDKPISFGYFPHQLVSEHSALEAFFPKASWGLLPTADCSDHHSTPVEGMDETSNLPLLISTAIGHDYHSVPALGLCASLSSSKFAETSGSSFSAPPDRTSFKRRSWQEALSSPPQTIFVLPAESSARAEGISQVEQILNLQRIDLVASSDTKIDPSTFSPSIEARSLGEPFPARYQSAAPNLVALPYEDLQSLHAGSRPLGDKIWGLQNATFDDAEYAETLRNQRSSATAVFGEEGAVAYVQQLIPAIIGGAESLMHVFAPSHGPETMRASPLSELATSCHCRDSSPNCNSSGASLQTNGKAALPTNAEQHTSVSELTYTADKQIQNPCNLQSSWARIGLNTESMVGAEDSAPVCAGTRSKDETMAVFVKPEWLSENVSSKSTVLDKSAADHRLAAESKKRRFETQTAQSTSTNSKRAHLGRHHPASDQSAQRVLNNTSASRKAGTSETASTKSATESSRSGKSSSRHALGPALNTNLKPRARQGSANDPQSIAARNRRERINARLKILQELVPNGSKVDLVTMLEKAINYVKFLQLQLRVLSNDDYWTGNDQDRALQASINSDEDVTARIMVCESVVTDRGDEMWTDYEESNRNST